MAFGFGGGLSAGASVGGGSRSGLGGLGRGLSSPSLGRSSFSDFGVSRSSGGFNPRINPELGGSAARRSQLDHIAREFGATSLQYQTAVLQARKEEKKRKPAAKKPIAGFKPEINPELGGSIFSASQRATLETLGIDPRRDTVGRATQRAVASLFGVKLESSIDPKTGLFGIRGSINPVSLLGNFQTFAGATMALNALVTNAVPTSTALGALLETLGSSSPLSAVGNLIGLGIPLGFEPQLPAGIRQSILDKGAKLGRAGLTAAERTVFDAAVRQQERELRGVRPGVDPRAEHERGEDTQGDDDTSDITPVRPRATTPIRAVMPPGSGTGGGGQAIVTRDFRRARGADTSSDLNLLRTAHEADVAAGVAPPRPSVLSRGPRTRIL